MPLRCGVAFAAIVITSASALTQSTRSVWTGVYTAPQATTGEELYAGACARCHGEDLDGRERAPALAGGTFGQRWDGASLKKMFERFEQMPPDDPSARLTTRQYVDILAFVLSANDVPPGTERLPADKDMLAGFTYTSQRPRF
jgi:mono/diheme cytochrome c family protein